MEREWLFRILKQRKLEVSSDHSQKLFQIMNSLKETSTTLPYNIVVFSVCFCLLQSKSAPPPPLLAYIEKYNSSTCVPGPGCCCEWRWGCGDFETSHHHWRHWDCYAAVGQRCVPAGVTIPFCWEYPIFRSEVWTLDWLFSHTNASVVLILPEIFTRMPDFYCACIFVMYVEWVNSVVVDRLGCGDEAELWMDSTDVCC